MSFNFSSSTLSAVMVLQTTRTGFQRACVTFTASCTTPAQPSSISTTKSLEMDQSSSRRYSHHECSSAKMFTTMRKRFGKIFFFHFHTSSTAGSQYYRSRFCLHRYILSTFFGVHFLVGNYSY